MNVGLVLCAGMLIQAHRALNFPVRKFMTLTPAAAFPQLMGRASEQHLTSKPPPEGVDAGQKQELRSSENF